MVRALIENRRCRLRRSAVGAGGVLMAVALLVSTACADAPTVTGVTAPTVAPLVASPVTTAAPAPMSPAPTSPSPSGVQAGATSAPISPAPTSPSPSGVQAVATSSPTAPVLGADFTVERFVQNIMAGPHEMIASADGGAELLIPQGALPPGVAAKDIAIIKLAQADAPLTIEGEPPLVAYQLMPDGLQLVQPVAIRLRSLAAGAELPGVFHIAGERVTLLDHLWVELHPGSGTAQVTGLLSGFSTVAVTSRGVFEVQISYLGDQAVGKPFVANVRVHAARWQSLTNVFTDDPYILRLVDPWEFRGMFFTVGPLNPSKIDNAPALTSVRGDALTASGTFTCDSIHASARVKYTAILLWKYDFVYKSFTQTDDVRQELEVQSDSIRCVSPPTGTTTAVTAPNRPPVLERFTAIFRQPERSTFYEVRASDPDDPYGDFLSYLWIYEGPPCGAFNPEGSTGPKARWLHPDDTCPTGHPHAATITVVVSDPGGREARFEYTGGSQDADVKFVAGKPASGQ